MDTYETENTTPYDDQALARELNANVNLWDEEGKLQLHKEEEAVRAYFLEHVNGNMQWFHDGLEEKIDYMFGSNPNNHEYWDREVFEQYEPTFIKNAFRLAYSFKFRFSTLMGAMTFMNKYAARRLDGQKYLERFEDRVVVAALALGRGDTGLVRNIIKESMSGRMQLATPTFANAGKKNTGALVSCRLLEVDDDLNNIMVQGAGGTAALAKRGAGVALNVSSIREIGSPVKGKLGAGRGVVPWLKIFESVISAVDQLGTRSGACAAYYHAHGWDVLDFIDSKKVTADEETRLRRLSLGLIVPDLTYQLAAEGKQMALFSVYDVRKELGVPFSDIDVTARYQELLDNPKIRKRFIPARDFFLRVAKTQGESGYPYILNIDHANKANPAEGRIKHSNLCTEILQISTPSVINSDREYEVVGRDVSCNLASLNVANAMRSHNFGRTIETAMRALTSVSDMDEADYLPSLKRGNELSHSVGLGMMNLAGFIAGDLGVEYDSNEARDFAQTFAMMMNYYSILASMKIAKERSEAFYEFEKSDYASGAYFEKYFEQSFEPVTELVKEVFEDYGHHVPTPTDWKKLANQVKEHGLYNLYRLATPPTGSISYLSGGTASSSPVVAPVETRTDAKLGTIYVPAYGLNDKNLHLYKDTYAVGPKALIDMTAVIQPHIDQGVSMTLFYQHGTTAFEIYDMQRYAWLKGLKTTYYTRVMNTASETIEGCVSCAL